MLDLAFLKERYAWFGGAGLPDQRRGKAFHPFDKDCGKSASALALSPAHAAPALATFGPWHDEEAERLSVELTAFRAFLTMRVQELQQRVDSYDEGYMFETATLVRVGCTEGLYVLCAMCATCAMCAVCVCVCVCAWIRVGSGGNGGGHPLDRIVGTARRVHPMSSSNVLPCTLSSQPRPPLLRLPRLSRLPHPLHKRRTWRRSLRRSTRKRARSRWQGATGRVVSGEGPRGAWGGRCVSPSARRWHCPACLLS